MRVSIHITCNLFLIFKKKNPGELRRIRCVSCLFLTAAQFSRLTGRAAGRRWRLKWIAGALKPIYLIDGWTRSVGLTSGANCKLDFFFSLPPSADCVAVSPLFVTPPTTHRRRTLGEEITRHTDIMKSTIVSVSHLPRPPHCPGWC